MATSNSFLIRLSLVFGREPVPCSGVRLSASTGSQKPQRAESLSVQKCDFFHTTSRRRSVVRMMSNHDGRQGDSDEDYMQAFVVDAVAMQPVRDDLYMTMANGTKFEVSHINPMAGKLLFKDTTPTIILRMVDNENIMLPIVVGGTAMSNLLQALRKEQSARPNCYDLMMEMIKSLDHELCAVKIEQRVVDTYFARLYVCKRGGSDYGSAQFAIDARPSDAINLAVRCNVPIFVHRNIVLNDAVQLATGPSVSHPAPAAFPPAAKHDDSRHEIMGLELSLLTKLMNAAEEERYKDAAKIRDELTQLRQQGSWRKV